MNDKIIRFERGIPGFVEEKEFRLYEMDTGSPFSYLQSVRDEELSFIVVSPFLFFHDYEFKLSEEVKKRLDISTQEDLVVLTVVKIRESVADATLNLLAPIVINQKNLQGEQIILESTQYSIRHPLFPHPVEAVGGE